MPTLAARPILLESGDNLSRAEFHRRYEARPDIKRAELIDGVVYVASPVRVLHAEPHGVVVFWLHAYKMHHPDVRVGDNATVLLDAETEVQPDACLWREEPGGPHLTAENYIEGPPQLVVEVAASSAAIDLHQKLRAYERNGVREYVVWRVLDEAVDWFRLVDGRFALITPDAEGVIASSTFPGLRLSLPALLAKDLAAVLAAVS